MAKQLELKLQGIAEKPGTVYHAPKEESPPQRLERLGERTLALWELLAIVIGSGHGTDEDFLLANLLLSEFGSLSRIAAATANELMQFDGIGKAKAARLKAALELGRRMTVTPLPERSKIQSPADAANFLIPEMMHFEQEHLNVILLNTRNEVLAVRTIYVGSLNTAVVRIGEIFKEAIKECAASLIVAHNHPSGDPNPSPEDVRVTREIVRAGSLLNIDVLDHVIIGHNRYTSLKERGLGFD